MSTSRHERERRAMKAAVASAFKGVRYPGDEALLATDCLDDGHVEDFRCGLSNTDWRDVSPETIDRNHDGLLAFSPSAFRFFLPAYLSHALDAFYDDSSCVLPSLLYTLNPQIEPSCRAHRLRLEISLLTQRQRRVVREFLEFVAEYSDDEYTQQDAQLALNAYWSQDANAE